MNISDHTYTGGEYYWIAYVNGTYNVRKMEEVTDNITVFSGNYEECVQYLNNLVNENADYDLNL